MQKVTFDNSHSPVYNSIKKAVESYFEKHKVKTTGNFHLYFKTIVLLTGYVGVYIALLLLGTNFFAAFGLSVLLGVIMAGIGQNIMHDSAHGSYSSSKFWNYVMSHSMNILGGTVFFWKIKHNVIHHSYTNIEGMDDDIAKSPLFRFAPQQPRKKIHRFQHIYCFPLYALAGIYWALISDMSEYFNQKIGRVKIKSMSFKEHFIFWFSKLFFVTAYLIIPVYLLGWLNGLVAFVTMFCMLGLVLSIVFQIAHVVEGVSFPEPNEENNKIEEEWAVHQLMTTANFAPKNKLVTWYVGGLNFQIEHHLFSRVSHIHYPAISRIVKTVCLEHGVEYKEFPTFRSGILSHIRHLRKLGQIA